MSEKKSWRDYSKSKTSEDETEESGSGKKTGSWRDYTSSKTENGNASGGWRDYRKSDPAAIVGNNVVYRVNSWLDSHNAYISDYQKRNSGRKYTYEDAYVSDSSDWLNTATQRKSELDAEAEAIISYLDQHKGYLDASWAEKIKSTLSKARETNSQIVDYSTKDHEWWSGFGSEDLVKQYGSAEEVYKYYQRDDGYRKKYSGLSSDELAGLLDTLEDGEEKDWMSSYKASVYHDEMLKYDTGKASQELDTMEKVLQTYGTAARYYDMYQANPDAYNDSKYDFIREWVGVYEDYQQKFGSQKELEQEIQKSKRDLEYATKNQAIAELSSVAGNADFGEKSQYVNNVEYERFGKPTFTDNTYAYINNPVVEDKRPLGGGDVTARDLIEREHDAYNWDSPLRNRDSSYEREALASISEDEVKIYNYLYATEGAEKANEYLDLLVDTFKDRKNVQTAQKVSEFANEHPWIASALSVGTSLGSGFEYIEDAIEYGANKLVGNDAKFDTNESALITNTVRGTVSDKVDWEIGNWDAFDFVYKTVMSGADSLASTAFGGLGGTVLGLSAAAQGTNDALERGMSSDQAFWNGLFSGVFEGLFETISLGQFNALKEVAPKNIKDIFKNLGKSMLVNASEETLTEIANIGYDTLVNGEFANYTLEELENGAWKQALQQVLEAGASGALMGVGMGGISTGMGYVGGKTQANAEAVKQYGDRTGDLIQEGLGNDTQSTSYKLAQKYQQKTEKGKALSGQQIRKLLEANQEQVTAKDMKLIQQAAEQRLTTLGQTEDVSRIAELATKYATGGKLSKEEKTFLTSSKYGSRVANELMPQNIESGDYSTDWAEGIGTKSVNAVHYNIKNILAEMTKVEDPAAYKSLESRVEAEEPAKVSNTGKAVVRATGEEIDLASPTFKQVGEDGVMLEANGKMVNANDIDYDSEEQGRAINSIGKIEHITPAAASALYAKLDMEKPVMAQLNGMDEAFTYGFYNYSEADLNAGLFVGNLTQEQKTDAYKLGQYVAKNTATEKADAMKKMRTAAEAKVVSKKETTTKKALSGSDAEVYFMDGKTVKKFDEHTGKYDDKRMAGVNYAKFLSNLGIGSKYFFYESYIKDGKRVYKDANGNEVNAPNGFYKTDDGSIYIDLNAGNRGDGFTLYTLGHELTHFIKQWSEAKFQVLADFLIEEYGKTDMSMHQRVLEKQSQLEKSRGEKVSYDEAFEEVVADAMSTMLSDGNLHEKLAKLRAQDKGLFNKIKKFFEQLVAKFKDIYAELTPDQKDAQDVQQMKEAFDRIQTAFAEALVEASDNFKASEAQKNTTEDGGVEKYSQRYLAADTNAEILSMVNKVSNGEFKANEKVYLGTVADVVANQIYGLTGIRVNGFKVAIEARQIEHILKDHGAHGATDHSMADPNDIAKMEYALTSPDDIRNAGKTQAYLYMRDGKNRHSDTVLYEKNIGAKSYYVVQAVPDTKAKTLYIVTAFIGKSGYKKEASQLINANSLDATVKTEAASASKENVAQDTEKVKYESTEEVGMEVDEKTESVSPAVMNSERTWTESDYVQERDKAAKEIAKAIGVSEKKAKDYIDSINSIAKMIAENRSRLDYFSSPGRSSFVDNSEYGGSFDFSTLCKKRRLLTGTFTAIQKALPNTALTADEILDIRNRMKEKGLEVSCGLCYVEGSRANMGQFAKEFLRLYKQYYPDAWQPNMADVNTPDGIEWVRINHPECYEQYEYFWNHYGTLKEGDKNLFASQQKPKLYQLHTEYKGEILKKFKGDEKVEEKNLNGGIRLQSFSDFEIVHLIDTMQIIMDMSRVGLAGQAYTKVPDFAWALGDTGLKINLSLIAKGVDADGKLIFDDVEGMPIAEAMKLRDRYSKNVGTILVAFNDEQLLAAMADDRVDFIIPFHRSQWKKSQYGAMGLPAKTKDYTFMQNEKFIKPQFHEYRGRMVKDKATNYMPNEYWDFSKSGKENAEAYLEMCARNNKRPKFYKLLINNGDGSYSLKADGSTDGYWKLLIDFKMYDNEGNGSPQMAVKPEFNMAEANRMLNEYAGGHSNFPVAQGIVDDFVKEYKKSHKGVKYSDRDSTGKQLGEDQLEYFEKSMVRDRNGNLQVVYHGGTVEYEFDTTRGGKGSTQYGPGSYFTDSEYYAKEYTWYRGGDVRGYYLNIENMFDDTNMDATAQMPQWKKLEQILRRNGIEDKFIERFKNDGFAYMSRYLALKAGAKTSGSWEGSEQLNAMLREAGFDGIKGYLNDVYQYAIFTPNQAKLTTNEVPSAFYDTRYSERTGDSVSNRSLLANAFEGITQNSNEYKLIQEYKSHVAELNSLEAKLSEFNREIRRIRFTEGAWDAAKLQRLEDEANKIAKAINQHDKKLLSLEASEPLRKVIERERKKEAQKTKDHVKEIQQNKKVRAEQTELRHKIRKAVRDLDKLLNRGNKKLNVKEDVQGVVSKALKAADILFTDHYGNYDMLRNGIGADLSDAEEALVATCTRMLKDLDKMPTDGYDNFMARQEAEKRLSAKMSKLKDVFARERKRLNNTTVSSILGELADAYASLEKSEQSYVQGAYIEAVHSFLKNLQSEVGGTVVSDMTKDQLESVYAAYKMVLTTVRKANQLFNDGLKMSREQLGNAVIQEVMIAGGTHGLWTKAEIAKSQFDWNNMKPVWVANRIGSESFGKLWQGLFEGQYNFAKDIEEAKQFKLEMDKKYKPRSWDAEKQYKFMSSTGKEFSLNLQQIMSLYAFSKREQAYSHLLNGGFVFEGNSTMIVDEKGRKKTYIHNGATSYKLNEATLNGIINSLTKEQMAYVDEMQKYLSEVMGEKGNEVSMQLYGIKMFKEQFYFPLRSSGAYMERAKEAELKKQQGQINLVNSGFTHAVKPEAKNPIILSGFMDVWAEHCNEMSMYHSMVLPMEDFRKVYNYSTPHEEGEDSYGVYAAIKNAYGKAATDYIDQLYRELNAGATVDPRETPWKSLISKFKKSAVMMSASVVVQQFSSIGRAYAVIDPKHFTGAKVNSDTKLSAAEEMKKYAPVAIIKEMGGFDTGTKGSAKSYIMAEKYGKGERLQGLKKDEQYRSDLMGYLPAKADEKTWCAIWEAAKRETKAKHPKMDVKSEEFLKLAGERFSEVIEKTQVYDSVLARSANMRSKGAFMAMATAFMAEPTTTINLIEDAIRSGDKKHMARAFGSVAVSIVLNNALSSIVYAMRDDDEDETLIEKYFQSFTAGMIDDINPMSYYPFLKDVYSLFQGYDVERADMSVIADVRDALKKAISVIGKDTSEMDDEQLAEHYKTVTGALMSLVDAGCSMFGVPFKNVRRDAKGIINAFTTAGKDLTERDATWNSFWDKVGAAAKDTIPVLAWTKDKAKGDKLYDAIVSGDKAYLARLKSAYKTEDAYQSAVRKVLRENDPRIKEAAQARYEGNIAECKRIYQEIKKEGKFDPNDILEAIYSEEAAIRNELKPETETSDYSATDFVNAVIYGEADMAQAMMGEIIATKVANGKTEEEAEAAFCDSVSTATRNAFDAGLLDEAGAENMLLEYAGKDEEEAASKVSYWAFCKEHSEHKDVFTEANVAKFYEFAEPAEIPVDVYAQLITGTKGLETIKDEWGDEVKSKREQVLEVIDSLPLTWQQKDALYLAYGYAESTMWDVPW